MKYSTTRNLINNAGFFILSGIIMLSPVIGNIFNQWDGVFPVFLISTVCATILLTQVWLRSTSHTPVKITTTDIGFTLYLTYGVLRLNIFKETFDPITLCEWSGLTAIYISTRWGKPKFVTWLLYALLVGGIIQALIGLCQFAGILESNNTTFKITGSFMNPEPYGGFLALSTIVCLSTWKKETYTWTGFHLLLPCILLLLTTTLILSDSRAAWLAVFVSSCFLFIKRNTPYHHWHMKLVVGLLATLLVVALYYYKKPSADVRLLTWNSSSLMFLDKPILGHGIGSFPANYMLYQAQFLNEHPGEEWEIIADNNITAFNEFIHLACLRTRYNWVTPISGFIHFRFLRHPIDKTRADRPSLPRRLDHFRILFIPGFNIPDKTLFPVTTRDTRSKKQSCNEIQPKPQSLHITNPHH